MEINDQAELEFKGALIFNYLKTGKIPQRKGLFRTLFYLAGQHNSFRNIVMSSSSTTLKRPGVDRTIEIAVESNLDLNALLKIFDKYLVNYSYSNYNDSYIGYLTVYYIYADIQWALIDHELKTNHIKNIKMTDGFPKIINYKYAQK